MLFLKKTIGFMAVLGVIPGASALTARPSMVATASSRMPTMSMYVNNASSAGTTTTTTASSLLNNADCIDAYTSCMKGADACGASFEECTNKVLFHAKMPQCLSTLAQCTTDGITSLFGIGNTTSLSAVATKNSYGEVTDYTYPTDGSVIGQLITGAAISNRYDTSTCVRRYTSCLQKDSVCGADFELCTTNAEFKKQRVFCDSTLARCQSDGVIELFGSATTTANPTAASRIGTMITEGASLAAVNAVSTCYKVADQCIMNACAENPYKCHENSSQTLVAIADAIKNGDASAADVESIADVISKAAVSSYIKGACLDTVGGNKYCYATFMGNGVMPTASQLRDEDNREEVYDQAYSARMNSAMKAKIAALVDKFDTNAKAKCTDTIKGCAMRVCGGGSGAACYSKVFGATQKSINATDTRDEIKTGCQAVVNTDLYCKYAAQNPTSSGTYTYSYIKADAFDTLFPEYGDDNSDPIGVVAALNASLASSYSDAAIAAMKKNCQAVATSCVKTMCGTDYENCYRNRTDIYSDLTNTGDTRFDKSMNKVGGVLDYTIVLGMCLDTVKNASVCEEHLAIESAKIKAKLQDSSASAWGDSSTVRGGWIDAGGATKLAVENNEYQDMDENGELLCTAQNSTARGRCNTMECDGKVCDTPVMISEITYVQSQAASTLFKDLIYDIEKEAQAKYNAKLTKQQNMCMSSNDGGLVGAKDNGSTYMWVKLKSNKVPNNYASNGLTSNQFVASNDLYGSFCRIRVTLQSDDKVVQDAINKGADWSTRYFAAGDAFTCGSWLTSSDLEKITDAVVKNETAAKKETQKQLAIWLPIVAGLGSTVGGAYLGNSIYEGRAFGKLSGLNSKSKDAKSKEVSVNRCTTYADRAKTAAKDSFGAGKADTGKSAVDVSAKAAIEAAKTLKVENSVITDVEKAVDGLTESTTTAEGVVTNDGKFTAGSISTLTVALNALSTACETAAYSDGTDSGTDASAEKKKRDTAIGVTSVLTGLAGAGLTYGVTASIQKATMSKAEQEALDAWMDEIGKHIRCYIGSEEVGVYGDTIGTSME